jgi:hypothetical protein
MSQPTWKNYRVDFREKRSDRKRFATGFTFTLADDPKGAEKRIREERPDSEVEILEVSEWER